MRDDNAAYGVIELSDVAVDTTTCSWCDTVSGSWKRYHLYVDTAPGNHRLAFAATLAGSTSLL